jgi:CheY-like chemotaxis protein
MHGDEFAAKALELIPDVPILFVTGYAEPGRMGQRTGGDMLRKPFRRNQLAEKLRWILRFAALQSSRNAVAVKPQ